eukprot:10460934-Karenia_brevis.AAC.1
MDTSGGGAQQQPPQAAATQPIQQQEAGYRQDHQGGGSANVSPSSGPTGSTRALQGVGPPPRATARLRFNQVELDNVVQHFLDTLPQGSLQ